jgi:probable HAF family extracellular repeat protein
MNHYRIPALAVAFISFTATAQVEFRPLGQLPGGSSGSGATTVSADGSAVAGWSNSTDGEQAFRWSLSDGLVGLGDLPGGVYESQATAISGDGGTIVGYSVDALGPTGFLWTTTSGLRPLTAVSGQPRLDLPAAINHDGTVIAGDGFRWSLIGGRQSLAQYSLRALNPTGSIWVGEDSAGRPFLSESGSIVYLGNFPAINVFGSARSVSSDGAVVVGYSSFGSELMAFRWTAAGGMVALGFLDPVPGTTVARSVSGDGRIVVGEGTRSLRNNAFIWTASLGMRDLKEYLQQLRVQGVEQWYLGSAAAVSSDGTTIVGTALGPDGWEAYRVKVPCNANLIATQPADAHASIGANRVLTVTANDPNATFQWKRDGNTLLDSSRFSGATSSTLHVQGLTASDQGTLTCLVQGSCGNVETSPLALSCRPRFTSDAPAEIAVVAGSVVQLQCAFNTSGTTTLRWKRNGQPLFNNPLYSGVTTATLTINAADPTLAGFYTLTATNPCGATVSTGTALAVLCIADRNFDGGIDGDDISAFFGPWESGDAIADINADGGIDYQDVEAFFEHWESGC